MMGLKVKKYAKMYRSVLEENAFTDIDARIKGFEERLFEMYQSQAFAKHHIYSTVDMPKIYAVAAMCLELKKENFSDEEIISMINAGLKKLRKKFLILLNLIDNLPNAYQIAKKWNINDHDKRVKDGSLTYDYFEVSNEKIEYRISKCAYVEIFSYYGIRGLCKICCLTDEFAYANLPKHIKFIRHSDLSDGECCHDEVIRKKKQVCLQK